MAEWKDNSAHGYGHEILLAGTVSVRVRADNVLHNYYRVFVNRNSRDLTKPTTLPAAKAEALQWARELFTLALKELDDAKV